ncbi:MAG: hypothetical protein VCF24_29955 [Candidatus Latescibacterota bacterium]
MRVMTCNVRTSLADDGLDNWSRRRDFCLDVIRAQSVDLLGFQEVQRDQYDDLSTGLPQYAAWGMVDEPHTVSPTNAVMFRTQRFDLLSQGGFWMSETPPRNRIAIVGQRLRASGQLGAPARPRDGRRLSLHQHPSRSREPDRA